MLKFDPLSCSGDCEKCKFDDMCDHVRLSDSQKEACNISGCMLVGFLFIVFITVIIGVLQ